jgi:hypothetical protein
MSGMKNAADVDEEESSALLMLLLLAWLSNILPNTRDLRDFGGTLRDDVRWMVDQTLILTPDNKTDPNSNPTLPTLTLTLPVVGISSACLMFTRIHYLYFTSFCFIHHALYLHTPIWIWIDPFAQVAHNITHNIPHITEHNIT